MGYHLSFFFMCRNIIDQGFQDPVVLADSSQYDAVLCVKIADIDFDGQNEILIGTYGQVTIQLINVKLLNLNDANVYICFP